MTSPSECSPFGRGASLGRVVLRPVAGALEIEASVPADGDLDVDRWAQVVADHLPRFGQRDELEVVWA